MKLTVPFTARLSFAAAAILAVAPGAVAGDKEVNKEIAEQAKAPFPVHISLTAGYDSAFVFRGVNILPDKTLNLVNTNVSTINSVPGFQPFLNSLGVTTEQFVSTLGLPNKVKVNKGSDIGYFDANLSAYGLTAGAFYAMQTTPRIEPDFFGRKSFFIEYREIDAYLNYGHSFGPVSFSIGGTYYHVEQNSMFDTAELNFGVSYTPPQFQYVTASFSYDYAGSLHYTDYLDGHHLELRISGNVPILNSFITVSFNPYIALSAGAGIIPRAFSISTLPTFFSNKAYAAGLRPAYEAIFNQIVNGGGGVSGDATTAARAAFDPATLDRDFDLSNLQVGFKVPITFKYFTLTGDASYSRPLGNLQKFPYDQRDNVWGGANLNFTF